MANIGPSSPDALGLVAERGLRFAAQVTSLGVGIDYDERTLNALAVRSSGRLYHLGEPSEMRAILRREMDLLGTTVASDAFVEVVPAPGVQLVPVDGVRAEWSGNGVLRIPLGVLFGGQHREALVRARFHGTEGWSLGPKPIASVRLHFRDPTEGDLERVQEVVARVQSTFDGAAVASHANARTRSIIAVQDAAKLQISAAQSVNQGQFDKADDSLAVAEKKLVEEARSSRDERDRERLTRAAAGIASARATTHAAASAPAPVRREDALKLNSAGMSGLGY
jgi:Ca-activated chloride channel family protein